MLYCTLQDLLEAGVSEAELIQLTDSANIGVMNISTIDVAISDASQYIDSILMAAGYALPLASTPSVLKRVCVDITRYYLFGDARPDFVETNYRFAVRYLNDLADKKASLPTSALSQNSTIILAASSSSKPYFTDSLLSKL